MLVNLQSVCRSWLTYKVLICTHIIRVTDAIHLVSTYYNATRAIMLLIQFLGSLHFANCLSLLQHISHLYSVILPFLGLTEKAEFARLACQMLL